MNHILKQIYRAAFKTLSIVGLALLFLIPFSVQAAEKTLKVGVSLGEPFASVQNNNFTGIAIDLWKKMADDLGLKYELISLGEHVDEAIDKLTTGQIDVLIGPIVPTYDRMKKVDFLQPYYLAELGLVIPVKKIAFLNAFTSIFDSAIFTALIILAVFYILYLHVYWYYEIKGRKINKQGYWTGIAESFWLHSLDIDLGEIPTHIRTRQVRFVWLILLALFFSSITATITSALTIALSHQYSSHGRIDDFKDQPVAAVLNTAPYDLIKNVGFSDIIPVNNRDEAVQLVLSGKVATYAEYYPIADYYLSQHQLTSKLTTRNLSLQRGTFSFALPINSPLRHPLDVKLLSIKEYGLVKLICKNHYKGSEQGLNNCEV